MDNRKLKKQRETAAKLSRPRPVELPSGKWRCQVMVDGKRFDVIEDDPGVAHAKALAMKAGVIDKNKPSTALTVGEAIDRYIESKDAVLSPSTIRGYRSLRENALLPIAGVPLYPSRCHSCRCSGRSQRRYPPRTARFRNRETYCILLC